MMMMMILFTYTHLLSMLIKLSYVLFNYRLKEVICLLNCDDF
jgi:hypothetical protein